MSQPSEDISAAASAGERLKRAREAASLSVDKVAKDLYLDARVVLAIEANRFNELGAPVYAKGYLRKYSRLLGLPEEEVLTQYEKSPDATPAPVQIPAALGSIRETRRPLPTWVRWLVLAIILVAGITTLVNLRSNDIEPKEQDGLISKPVGTTRDGSIASGDSTAAQGPLAESTSPLQALMNNAASAGELTIRFNFSGESWVEVYDAQNHQVLHEMGTANTTREISAAPPLRVVLGASAMVKVNVNSRDIEIPASAVQANVAKFEVKADGSLK